jgi:hypothetical protein
VPTTLVRTEFLERLLDVTRPGRMPKERRRRNASAFWNVRRQPEGWLVAVIRRGETVSDYFGDAVYGSRAKALRAAQHFRDRLLLRIPPDTRVRRRMPRGLRSKTGVLGVSIEAYKVSGRVYHRYVACWQDFEKRPRRRRFLVERYGEERALALATKAREEGVARSHEQQLARQREAARRRLAAAGPPPRPVRDPRSRKGISMARRRPRRTKSA